MRTLLFLAAMLWLTLATSGASLLYLGIILLLDMGFRRLSLPAGLSSLVTGMVVATWIVVANFYWGKSLDRSVLPAFLVFTLVAAIGCHLARSILWRPWGASRH